MGSKILLAVTIVISSFVYFINSNFLKSFAPNQNNANNLIRTFSKEKQVHKSITKFMNKVTVKKEKVKNPVGVLKIETQEMAFINRYALVAHREKEKSGVPTSVTLAQAILESNIGKSSLALKANNFFGRKCVIRHKDERHCLNYHDDNSTDRFKKYASANESFQDHSRTVTAGRYKPLTFKKPCAWGIVRPSKHKESVNKVKWQMAIKYWHKPHLRWAYGLDAMGYATDEDYAKNLIQIINKYKLTRYDF